MRAAWRSSRLRSPPRSSLAPSPLSSPAMTTARSSNPSTGPQQRRGVEEDLRALQRLEPPGEERNSRVGRDRGSAAASEPSCSAKRRGSTPGCATQIRSRDARYRRMRSFASAALAATSRSAWAASSPSACARRASSGRPGARLGQREGVERLHPGDVPRLAELAPDQAAVPVVAVDGAIRTSLRLRRGGSWRR